MDKKFKVTFKLDEEDAAYFRGLYRKAKKDAASSIPSRSSRTRATSCMRVRASKKTPRFVLEAIGVLADLMRSSRTRTTRRRSA